jgi:hypothetical protein
LVVSFIEAKFPWIEPGQPPAPFAERGAMRGLVRLTEKIPEELLVLRAADYAELIMAVGVLEIGWQEEGPGREYAASERSAIRTLHHLMQLCPDDYPPAGTTEPAFIRDDGLREQLRHDIGEVNRAHRGKFVVGAFLFQRQQGGTHIRAAGNAVNDHL